MTKKGLGIAVLLSLGIAVLSGCGAKSSAPADVPARAMPAAEAAAEEKTGEAVEAAAEEKTGEAAESAAEEKGGEKEGAQTLSSRVTGVYSCEQDGDEAPLGPGREDESEEGTDEETCDEVQELVLGDFVDQGHNGIPDLSDECFHGCLLFTVKE